jgi:hypothetical protein
MASKSAFKSVGFWGSLTAIGSSLTMFREILALYQSIPPELIQDTLETSKLFYASIMAFAGSVGALIGRWKAALPLSFLSKDKKEDD